MSACRFESRISPWLDGELDEVEARALERHLGACPGCATARRELETLVATARTLPPPAAPPPSWARIEARLDEPAQPAWRWPTLRLVVPALAAVTLAVGGGIALRHRAAPSDDALLADAQSEFGKAEAHYRRAVNDLRVLATREGERWPEERRARFRQALAALDESVAASRRASGVHPADPEAQEQLFSAYRRQIAFLEDSLLRGAAGDR